MSQLVLETLSRRVETKQNRPKRVADYLVVFTALTAGGFQIFPLTSWVLQGLRVHQIQPDVILPFRVQKHQDLKFTRNDAIKYRFVVQVS